jgi:hypothetical protein
MQLSKSDKSKRRLATKSVLNHVSVVPCLVRPLPLDKESKRKRGCRANGSNVLCVCKTSKRANRASKRAIHAPIQLKGTWSHRAGGTEV